MGEVRKRKVSAEEKNGKGAPEPQIIQKGGGLGLIPVVLIAAILAGSGCHVIKKDTAADIAELTRFIDDLKVRNSETLELVTSLRAAVVQKDAMIENLGKSLKATEDQALATDVRMEELKQDLLNAEEASKSRTEQISDLESKLESAKTEAEEKLNQINKVVNSLPTGVQEDLSKQGSEIVSVVSKLEALEAKVTEQGEQIGKNDEVVAAASAAQEEKLRGQINELGNKIESLNSEIIGISSTIPSEVLLVQIQDQAKKASDGLAEALDKLQKQSKDINMLKTVGEKGIGELNDSVTELSGNSEDHAAKIKKIESSIESSSSLIQALSNDIAKVKKQHAELAKQNTATQN